MVLVSNLSKGSFSLDFWLTISGILSPYYLSQLLTNDSSTALSLSLTDGFLFWLIWFLDFRLFFSYILFYTFGYYRRFFLELLGAYNGLSLIPKESYVSREMYFSYTFCKQSIGILLLGSSKSKSFIKCFKSSEYFYDPSILLS